MASETPPPPDRRVVRWPDGVQWVRQLAMVAVVLAAWSGLFYGAMRIPSGTDERSAAADARRDQRRAAAEARTDSAAEAAPADRATETADAAADPAPDEAPTPPAPAPRATPEPTRTASADAPAPAAAAPTPRPESAAAAPPPAVRPEPSRTAAADPAPPAADVPMEELTLDPLADAAAAAEEMGEVSFAADVLPIFERRCVKCHGGLRDDGTPRLEEGLSLLTVADVLAGSTWGSVVEPGDVAGSYLYELVESGEMPENEPRLLPREIRAIAAWIRAGAPNN